MASLENLPADQRAVLQLVLQRGRSYDEIAEMLSIDRAGVRQRALQALDALGPQTGVPPERRALITDYLLSQLPARVADDTRERLAESPSERAWARVVASELSSLAANPLPEIPVERGRTAERAQPAYEAERAEGREPVAARQTAAAREAAFEPRERRPREPRPGAGPPISRRGGAILLGLAAAVIVAVVVIVIANSGGSSHTTSSTTAASNPTTSPTTAASSTTTTGTNTSVTPLAQINLNSPTHPTTKGVAEVFRQGTITGLLIAAQNVPPNTKHDAYAVWLYNSPSDSHILGFVDPGVGSNGRLSTAGRLPSNAAHFKTLLVTRETARNPSQPGTIVLQGALTGLS